MKLASPELQGHVRPLEEVVACQSRGTQTQHLLWQSDKSSPEILLKLYIEYENAGVSAKRCGQHKPGHGWHIQTLAMNQGVSKHIQS